METMARDHGNRDNTQLDRVNNKYTYLIGFQWPFRVPGHDWSGYRLTMNLLFNYYVRTINGPYFYRYSAPDGLFRGV